MLAQAFYGGTKDHALHGIPHVRMRPISGVDRNSPRRRRRQTLSFIWGYGERGTLLATLAGHTSWVYAAAFSRDGERIVTASADHTARVWDAESGHLLATLTGHTARVNDAAFSPDGERIVTASQDKTARVWDAKTGLLLGTLTGHTDQVYRAAFSPDGKRIVTAGADNTARLYVADLHDLLDWAKKQFLIESGQ